ncbi:MAG: hypothetical protein ACYC96_03015 [Fimbriimonadaceae bacterium]
MSASRPLVDALASPPGPILSIRIRNLLLGALGGAAVMLLALPASRPYYFGILAPSSLDRALATTAAVGKGNPLPDARSLNGQAIWFSVAAGRILNGRRVSQVELRTVEQLMATASRAEPANAFWLQADATLLERLGNKDAAITAWLNAANRIKWDDHQTDFLDATLTGKEGVPSYAYAELYQLRTTDAARLILQGGRALLDATWDRPGLGMQVRLATVLNGNLVRRLAKSIGAMQVGTEIIESAVSKPSDEPPASLHPVKVLFIARDKFYKAIAASKLGYDYDAIESYFKEADAAKALTTIEDVHGVMQSESAEAAILHAIAGAFLLCTAIGAALIAFHWLMRRFAATKPGAAWFRTAILAAVAVIGALFVTSVYAAFALGLCIVFAGSNPAHVRKRRPTRLGPLFWVMTSGVAITLLLAGAAGFVLAAVPSRLLLLPQLPAAFDGSAAVCGVIALAIGFLFLCAPLWAFAQRVPTVHVLAVGLREVGTKLALSSLVLAVLSGPTCVFLDRLLAEGKLKHQFNNEFLYYYQKLSPTTSTQYDADPRP